MIQILLVHNRFHLLRPITWLSYFIRVFTCSKWNHLAILVQDHFGTQVIESIGKGVTITPFPKWLNHADRIVLPLTPLKQVDAAEVLALKGKPYGFLDLVQILRHIKATRWDGKPKWVGKNYKGYLCSELGCLLMGFDAFLTPADFEYLPEHFRKGSEFETKRNMKTTKNMPNELNEEQIAARAQGMVDSYASEEIAAILNKNESEFRYWLTEFAKAAQNPDQPLPPRP